VTDDLDVPLGQTPPPRKRRLRMPKFVPYALAALLLAAIGAFAAWTIAVDDPLGGEPFAVVSVHPAADKQKPGGSEKAAEQQASAAKVVTKDDGAQTVTVIDGMSGKRQQYTLNADGVAVSSPAASDSGKAPGAPGAPTSPAAAGKPQPTKTDSALAAAQAPAKSESAQAPPAAPAGAASAKQESGSAAPPAASGAGADPRLTETSPHGAIPKIGAGGERPSKVYASPLAPAAAAKGGAQIAIVVGRLGVSAKGTDDALAKLPAAVTVAFAPYGNKLETQVARAREGGREVLLQVPMEPFDYPDNDPGPRTLLTSLPPDQNLDRLHWFMSRFAGYVGIGNYMGMRFAANESAVSTLMRDVAKRGLIYFDDGSATRSLVSQIAAVNNVPFARADLILDSARTPEEMDAALTKLEALARERGSAVGAATALPASIDRIAKWAAGAEARGITLVPLSVIANKAKSS
jgi:polysaccharide deacetylase 2 family uncharacterized protein YibQ